MLDAPDIGDEIPLSFDLQISVYLASSLLIEKTERCLKQSSDLILSQGSGLFSSGSFEPFLKQSCSNPSHSGLQIMSHGL